MAQFISDEEMEALEKEGKVETTKSESFISDEEMEALEKEGKVETTKIPPEFQAIADIAVSIGEKAMPVKAFADQVLNSLVLGMKPQFEGAKAVIPAKIEEAGKVLSDPKYKAKPTADIYAEARDEEARRLRQQEEDYPLSSTGGKVVGSVAGGLLTPEIQGPWLLKGAGNVAALAAQEFLQNPGEVEGEISPLQIKQRVTNVQKMVDDPVSQVVAGVGFVGPAIGAIGKHFGPEEGAALAALGTRKQDLVADIGRNQKVDVRQSMNELSNFAKDKGLVPAFSPTWKMSNKVREMRHSVGDRIGEIRDKAQKLSAGKFQQLLDSEVGKYKSFFPEIEKKEIFAQIDKDILDEVDNEAVKEIVGKRLDGLSRRYGDIIHVVDNKILSAPAKVGVADLARLKSEWQDNIPLDKLASDYNLKQTAFGYLKRAANNAIMSEIRLTDDVLSKIKGSSSLAAEHKKLQKEYVKLMKLEDGVIGKMANEYRTNFVGKMMNSPMQSAAANVPSNIGGKAGMAIERFTNPQLDSKIEGFPEEMTMTISDVAAEQDPSMATLSPQFLESVRMKELDKINKSSLTNMQKAKRRLLLEKHGRVFMGE